MKEYDLKVEARPLDVVKIVNKFGFARIFDFAPNVTKLKNELIEFSSTYSDFYGLPKFSMQKALSTGKNVLLRLDTKGTLNLVKQYSNTISIFISPENIDQLIDQINQRAQDKKSEIEKRMQIAIEEIANANLLKLSLIQLNPV